MVARQIEKGRKDSEGIRKDERRREGEIAVQIAVVIATPIVLIITILQ